jgi:putative transposase
MSPRFWDEKSCLKLVFATLIRAAKRWVRVRMTELPWAQLDQLRWELGHIPPASGQKQHLKAAA